jgi:phosphohistidine phosphatase
MTAKTMKALTGPRRLYLMRHGKAASGIGVASDKERDLVERGEQDAALVMAAAIERGLEIDSVLVSAANRTRQTWAAISPLLPPVPVQFDDGLYLASDGAIMRAIDVALRAGRRGLLVIGHNPGIHDLAFDLSLRGRADMMLRSKLETGMPTSGLAWFEEAPGREAWELKQFLTPREFGGGPE